MARIALTSSFVLLAASALAAALPEASAPAPLEAAAAAAAPQETLQTFREKFDAARELGNRSRMKKLVGDNRDLAVTLIVSTAESISGAPNDVLVTRYEALAEAFDAAFDSDFPRIYERMFSKMRSDDKEKRQRLRAEYVDATRSHGELTAAKDKAGLIKVATDLKKIAKGMESVGDKYYASQAYLFEGIARDEAHQGKDADLDKVADAYLKCVELRGEIELKDSYYSSTKNRADALVGQGFGSAAKKAGGGAGGRAKGPKSAGPVVTATMEFEEIDALKDTQRPSYYLDEHRQIWPAVVLREKGSIVSMPRIKDGPKIMRTTAAKIMVDVDVDGEGDIEWPTRGKFEAFTFEIGEGDDKRPFRIMTEVGRQDDFYQGQQVNLLASDNQYLVYYIPAGSMVGDVNGTKIQVIDDNLDGIYGSPPQRWGHQGLSPETFQPEFDSIRVGNDKRAIPFSEYVNLGKAGWHKLDVKRSGLVIEAEPMEIETGTVQIKGKGVKPDFLILEGTDARYKNTFIDVGGGKKVDVPVGKWKISFGMISKGKGMQRSKAVILGGSNPTVYEVTAGENTLINYGAPYKFIFEYETDGDKVTVNGPSIQVLGAGGEIYDRVYFSVHYPEVYARKKGSKRGSGGLKLKPVVDNQGLQDHGFKAMWKPLPGEMPFKGDEIEVQLVEKKNRLFKKIESDWL